MCNVLVPLMTVTYQFSNKNKNAQQGITGAEPEPEGSYCQCKCCHDSSSIPAIQVLVTVFKIS